MRLEKLLLKFLVLSFLPLSVFVFSYISFDNSVSAKTDQEKREEELRAELERIEKEQAEIQKTLDKQKQESASLERDKNILSGQIKQAQLTIEKKNIEIGKLGQNIDLKTQTVAQLNAKLERSKEHLANLIRETQDLNSISLPEIVLSDGNLSDFFSKLDSYYQVQTSLEATFEEIRKIKGETESEKNELEKQRNKEIDVKAEIETEKRKVAVKETEKKVLLNASLQSELAYESILAEKQRQAESIRAALFQLRDTQGISFGEALKYAQMAERSTGVRAAFILGILKQESDLGKNVGTCNRAGDPPEKKWYSIMPGPNSGSSRDDQTIFKRIIKNLGLDIDSTPLSCPWNVGWGGAMGPSQFIPSTWAAYEARIAAATGVEVPNPWNPYHAITATAIYMKDLGASAGGYTAERTAALKYYAGGYWYLASNAFYGNSVMVHASGFQEQIDFLSDVED